MGEAKRVRKHMLWKSVCSPLPKMGEVYSFVQHVPVLREWASSRNASTKCLTPSSYGVCAAKLPQRHFDASSVRITMDGKTFDAPLREVDFTEARRPLTYDEFIQARESMRRGERGARYADTDDLRRAGIETVSSEEYQRQLRRWYSMDSGHTYEPSKRAVEPPPKEVHPRVRRQLSPLTQMIVALALSAGLPNDDD